MSTDNIRVGLEDGFEGQQFIALSERDLLRCADHPVARTLYPLTFGFFPAAPGHRVHRPEGKRGHTLIHCLHGRGRLEVGGGAFEISAGDVFYTPPYMAHLYETDDRHPWSTLWVRFEGELATSYTDMLGLSAERPVRYAPDTKAVLSRHQRLLAARKAYYGDLDLVELSLRLAGVLTAINAAIGRTAGKQLSVEDRVLQTIVYMEDNIHKVCTLAELVELSGLSRSHYCREFRALTGVAPMSHLLHMKINDAVQKLLYTDLKVEEIARSLGYSDPLYFSRVFKKAQGQSPSHYRASGRG